ncbi:MAG: sigma-70 family RNA polymerase sigma factor [Planctomycetes bacterium]|nr:sigma-70 family RNA polymerase sigma factor [Planctomycetota bacterium]
MSNVTRILNAIEQGDAQASEKLLPLVYEELRLLAAQKMTQERPGQTLQATALVHEAYIRLVGSEGQGWDNRGHFFAAAAEAMRRILVEDARRKKNQRHGGGYNRVTLNESLVSKDKTISPDDLLTLNEALEKLESEDKTKAELVKLRFFAGLTGEQAAKALGISQATAERYWAYARSWLRIEVAGEEKKPD